MSTEILETITQKKSGTIDEYIIRIGNSDNNIKYSIDETNYEQLLKILGPLIRIYEGNIVFDMRNIACVDEKGIGAICELEQLHSSKGQFYIVNAKDNIKEIMELINLYKKVPIYSTYEKYQQSKKKQVN
jgi:anti-anti-sigma factor